MAVAALAWWGVRCIERGNDFVNHFEAAKRVRAAEDPYRPNPVNGLVYVYPPLYAWLLVPLTALPAKGAAAVLFVLKLAAVAGVLAAMRRWIAPGALPAGWFYAGVLALTGRFLIDDFQLGQATLLVVCLAAWALFLKAQGRPGLSAAAMGLSIALKLLPGIFLVYYLLRREWKYAAWTACAAACWTLLPASAYGRAYPDVLRNFSRQQLTGAAWAGSLSGADNQSWHGVVMRHLGGQPTEMDELPRAAVATLPWAWLKAVVYAGDCAALAFLWWAARRWGEGPRALAAAWCVMLWVSPNSGVSYFSALMLPAAVLTAWVAASPVPARWAWMAAAGAFFTLTADAWVGRWASGVLKASSVMFWGLVVVMAALAVMRDSPSARDPLPS